MAIYIVHILARLCVEFCAFFRIVRLFSMLPYVSSLFMVIFFYDYVLVSLRKWLGIECYAIGLIHF